MGGPRLPLVGLLVVAGAGVAGLWIWKQGGIANAAASLGAGVVNTAGAVVSGGVGAIGSAVGLPTPADTTTEAEVARWLIDNVGQFEASKWAGAPAYLKAQFMAAGSGKPPAADSPAGREFLGKVAPVASYDEGDRLAIRYPGPPTAGPDSVFNGQAPSWGGLAGLDGGSFDYQPVSLFPPRY